MCTPTPAQEVPTVTPVVTAEPSPVVATTSATQSSPVQITIEGSKFAFVPSTFSVKKGQTVKITFKNVDGFHDLRIDEFKAFTKQIQGGASDSIEFVADKTGTFEYYCSVGNHRAQGMVGTLTVTE